MNDVLLFALLIVGVLTAIIAGLMAISKKEARARKAALRETYKDLLARNNLSPNHEDEFRHRILGMDTRQKVFVAVQHDGENKPGSVIPLGDVTDCTIRKSGHSVSTTGKNGKSHTEEFTDGIALSFLLRNGSAIDVPVYSEKLDGLIERIYLHQTAEKWRQLVRLAIGKGIVDSQ